MQSSQRKGIFMSHCLCYGLVLCYPGCKEDICTDKIVQPLHPALLSSGPEHVSPTVWPLLETRQFWEQKASPNSAWIWKFPVLGTQNLAWCLQYGPRANHFLITDHGADFSFHSDRHQSERCNKTLLRLQLIHPSYWSCWIHWSCCNCKITENWEMPKRYACLGISGPRDFQHLAAVHAWRQQKLTSCEKRWMHSLHLAGCTLLLLERSLLCSWASSQRARTQILPHTFSIPLFSATQSLRSALYLNTTVCTSMILLCHIQAAWQNIFSFSMQRPTALRSQVWGLSIAVTAQRIGRVLRTTCFPSSNHPSVSSAYLHTHTTPPPPQRTSAMCMSK